jgi:hypothetical protein
MKKLSAVTMVGIGFLLIVMCGRSFAQGLSSLSQIFSGGSKQSQNSSQSNAAITVKRDVTPFVGVFDGNQNASSITHLNARFACYPAHDSALPRDNTFLCYTAKASGRERSVSAGD